MRFEGYRLTDGRSVGELGVGLRNAPFPAPALAAGSLPTLSPGHGVLVAGNMLYHYVSGTRQALPRIHLPAGEDLAGVTPVGENLVVLSDRALYFFDGGEAVESEALLTPRQRVAIPGRTGDLRNIELIELVDGYLVSFSFTSYASNMRGAAPYQTLLWVDDSGHVQTIARRPIGDDYPALYRYQAWWPSPALYALRQMAVHLFGHPDPLQATAPTPIPRSIEWTAGSLMLLSLLGALWISRRRSLSIPARSTWVLACGVVGLPALVSLWLLYPDCEQADTQARWQPAIA